MISCQFAGAASSASSTMDSQIFDSIDIPPSDSRIIDGASSMVGAQIVVHLSDGTITRGTLKLLSYARKNLFVDTEDGPMLIPFSEVLYLTFSEKLKVKEKSARTRNLPASIIGDTPFQVFKVTLTNDQIVNGKMETATVDEGGIHIFKFFDNDHVVRLFFPGDSVTSYQLGERIGGALVKSKKLDQKALDNVVAIQKQKREKLLGDYLLEAGAITAEQLDAALSAQKRGLADLPEGMAAPKLGEVLVSEGLLTAEQLEPFLEKQEADRKKKIGDYLIDLGLAETDDVQAELANKVGVPFVRLESSLIEDTALSLVPKEVCEKYSFIPLRVELGKLLIAIDDPLNKDAIQTLHFVTNMPTEIVVAPTEDIEEHIKKRYDELSMNRDISAAESLHEVLRLDSDQTKELSQLGENETNAPIVRLVTRFIVDAVRKKASDIHLRPKKEDVQLLFRIDGEMVSIRDFKKSLLAPIISRIKIIGRMDISERRLPQDGGAQITESGNQIDLRISIMPTVEGESAVIRLLNAQAGLKSIGELGFNPRDAEAFADMMHKSFGLVLVTGPTGSGKSTTLYAALQEVIQRNLNVITVENPVEFRIEGIEQIQVNSVPGYTFAKALRQILRHDPDVIMIGEIRDAETSQIAVESALTGHLVLSTLHTNDAAGAVTRLLDMGIDPFLLNDTLLGVFAQRLVRRNCQKCLGEEEVSPAIRKVLAVEEDEIFYKGQGCVECRGSGFDGRIAAYELLQVSNELKKLLHSGTSTQGVNEQAIKDGMIPLTANALELARQRVIPLEEVYRVRLE